MSKKASYRFHHVRDERLEGLLREASAVAAETLWPTRCAVCDVPGSVLCPSCENDLEPIDLWRACPRCGAPFGLAQCTECNAVALARFGRTSLPFLACASAVHYSEGASAVVRTYKDQGEVRLARVMAKHMQRVIDPAWEIDCITYVPASTAARRRRGFDHAEVLAKALAERLGGTCLSTLKPPKSKDQRQLGRSERIRNIEGRMIAKPEAPLIARFAPRALLIDDVYTTGATLIDASDALLKAGFSEVRCATFARVY